MNVKTAALFLTGLAALAACTSAGDDPVTTSFGSLTSEDPAISRRSLEWDNPYAGTATEEVTLSVWGGETQDSVDFIKTVAKDFKKANPQSNYTINVKPVSESSVSGDWESDPSTAADVAIAADDQIPSMVASNYIQDLDAMSRKIPGLADDIKNRNIPEAVEAVLHDGKTYGFPVSASNGYVLFYNSKYINAEDTVSFDKLLKAIHEASVRENKNFTFGYPYNSGWYLDGWFHGAGFSAIGEAGATTVECNWNSTVDGVQGKDVAGAMLKLAHGEYSRHWSYGEGSNLMARIGDSSNDQVIATINGTWSWNQVKKNWGEFSQATVLPSYHLDLANKDIAMHSVKGFKIAVINKARAKTAIAAARFAEFLTNYESEILRYDLINEAPTNVASREQTDFSTNPCVNAVNEQWAKGAFVEKVNKAFWSYSNGLSVQLSDNSDTSLITSGAGTADVVINYDAVQDALDACVNSLAGN